MQFTRQYAASSLELHLFFARIMKEHALFLMAGFTPANENFTREAERFKDWFGELLERAVALADGAVSGEAIDSGEFLTPYTIQAERQTQQFTGIPIDTRLTLRETMLRGGTAAERDQALFQEVRRLNQRALRLLDGFISLKQQILSHVLSCRMFTMNYPLLLEHILREARLYRDYVSQLETEGRLDTEDMRTVEQFWNRIMMEHAQFIRGLLDPTEEDLIAAADGFARDYARLLEASRSAQDRTFPGTLAETRKFRDFKTAGVRGIEECHIRSVILPLLADHVLREANHYLRLLQQGPSGQERP